MNRLQALFLFFTVFVTTSFLFQNCAKMEAIKISSIGPDGSGNDGGSGDGDNGNVRCTPDTPIDELENRWLPGADPLDNEVSLNNQGEFEETIQWSMGSESVVFHYETKYPEATEKCKSTIVTIKKAADSFDVELEVDADNCERTTILDINKIQELTNIVTNSLEHKSEKTYDQNSNNTSGCSFPRFSMNNKSSKNGELSPDFDIYYTSEECVPPLQKAEDKDKVFISDTDSIDKMEEFFRGQIDSICQSSN